MLTNINCRVAQNGTFIFVYIYQMLLPLAFSPEGSEAATKEPSPVGSKEATKEPSPVGEGGFAIGKDG